ncbi:dethiobiotin synthetase [Novimethylophilus kurashikiensis]|uniref:ATP-dependent dethiobiotin synthetase BioD n=1 Tax=Novimethylophilus kurashikiensis TaxID=1825523 RepID=A0A2R5FD20_9PROT|nr:dethiobiotin synthase [Novimethylophilus kurashikiensis]GBG15448.1 dethiobiotin synthetase [Novimethylophilus kurashikiensis]
MKQGFFITGTDTGVGKTFMSCALLHHFTQQGYRAVGMKPVSAGCREVDGAWLSEDVEQLQAAGNVGAPLQTVNPYAFEPPLAPHIAAAQVGVEIALDPILQGFKALMQQADIVVVEGVGGFRVPLNATQDTADLAVALGLPVILVVGMRLGCLNHALLTAEAIAARGLQLAGWIANQVDPDMLAFEENLESLQQRLPAECLGIHLHQAVPDWREVNLKVR